MSEPNWQEINRCPIWKVIGVSECNNCDTVEQCWGTDINLDKVTGICNNKENEDKDE